MPAWLVVRAVVADPADRADFDHWYRTEHLPDALRDFHAEAAWRGWSRSDPSVHCAYYRFASVAAAEAATSGDTIKALVAEFDRRWGTRVTRTREIIDVADSLEASA
ncbi:MAG TPA: hypothetical protein VME47_18865 [Acetobacteraceae bacterium]|nr:hypothetical protein [Acetobacteraceae bacterium]